MARLRAVQTVSGQVVYYACAKPGPKPLPVNAKKRVVSLRVYPGTLARIDAQARADGIARSDWIERAILERLCNTQSG